MAAFCARPGMVRDLIGGQAASLARLARDGLSNSEIGTKLFLSSRTVEWHLSKVFGKLGISSRSALRTTLPTGDPERSFAASLR